MSVENACRSTTSAKTSIVVTAAAPDATVVIFSVMAIAIWS
jgi:hypothetical protein